LDQLALLPFPRTLTPGEGHYTLAPGRRIGLVGAPAADLLTSARRLQAALLEHAALAWELAASTLGPAEDTGVVLRVSPGCLPDAQGYTLTITGAGIVVEAPTPAGVFYGVCTLVQILEEYGRRVPALRIVDWPDFPVRGVLLDISRDKVPRLETLYALIDLLAGWKLNQLQLYTEHTFAYRQHPDVWAAASPVTGDEILALDAYCRERYIELVPNQNSFGHMERWLIHDRYRALAETPAAVAAPGDGPLPGPLSLCPGDPGSLALLRSLYDELLPHFASRQVNVGCDETWDLGQGRSRAECLRRGSGRVYLDYLLQIHREVTARGHTMQFWGDIIIQHPDLIAELPRDSIALEWGYEANHPFAAHCPRFAAAGVPFYVCPGTSAWSSLAGRTDNAIANLRSAAEQGRAHGAAGYLITDWGDHGHWQVLPVSYLGFAVGAAYAWAFDANRDMDSAAVLSRHAFGDRTGCLGRVAYDLGNVYRALGGPVQSPSLLFWVLQGLATGPRLSAEPPPDYAAARAAIDAALAPLAGARPQRPDAALILAEFETTAGLLRHACDRGQALLAAAAGGVAPAAPAGEMRDLIREYERIWLARNRPGGLADSVRRFAAARLAAYGLLGLRCLGLPGRYAPRRPLSTSSASHMNTPSW